MNQVPSRISTFIVKTEIPLDQTEHAVFDNNGTAGDDMAGVGITHEMKDVVEGRMVSEESSVDELKPSSTWQLVLQYRAAVLWSAFMGLAAINWGMDVLVSTPPKHRITNLMTSSSQTA